MIDLSNWRAVALMGTYLGCLALAVRHLARPKASHVLMLAVERRSTTRPISIGGSLAAAIAALAWSAALVVVETWAITRLAPLSIEGVWCAPRWLPPLCCDVPSNSSIAGRALGLAAVVAYATIALAVWLTARGRSLFPLAMLLLGLLTFGALADIVTDASSAARPEILFGTVAAIQLTAAAGLAFSLTVTSPRPDALLRLHTVYLVLVALRLLALLAWASLWPIVPSAIAVSTLLTLVLIPGVAGGAAIIAAAPDATQSQEP